MIYFLFIMQNPRGLKHTPREKFLSFPTVLGAMEL